MKHLSFKKKLQIRRLCGTYQHRLERRTLTFRTILARIMARFGDE